MRISDARILFGILAFLSLAIGSQSNAQTIDIVDTGNLPGVAFGAPITLRATAEGCTPDPRGWNWTATEDPAIVGASSDEATFTWVATGSTPIVTVTNSTCGPASDSKQIVLFRAQEARPFSLAKPPKGMIRGVRESDSITFVYTPPFAVGDRILELSGDPIPIELDSPTIVVSTSDPITTAFRFPAEVVEAATGTILSTNLVIRGTFLGAPTEFARIPIHMLLSESASDTSPVARTRADFSSGFDANSYDARITYTNEGSGRLEALLVPSVDWIDVGEPHLSLAPGETRDVDLTIVRSRRPDHEAPFGSAPGDVALVFARPTADSRTIASATAGSLAAVVTDTVKPPTPDLSIPPLGEGKVALFLPGVGHMQESVGLFISDVSIGSASETSTVRNLQMYFLPAGGTDAVETAAPAVTADSPVSLADIVKQSFGVEGVVGTLQLRPRVPDSISAVATVFNSSNPAGTYGTAIPVFRSDRSVSAGETLHITGLRKSTTSHTNLFLQEVSGAPATVSVIWKDATGMTTGTGTESLAAFELIQRSDIAPEGSASVAIRVDPSSAGRIIAFATPVDRASGDTWALTDWRRFYAYDGDDTTLVPVAGVVRGANATHFRTDLAIMNTGSETAMATLSYFGRAGERVTRSIDVAPGESRVMDDVVAVLFGVAGDSVGSIVVTPSPGSDLLTTSRTYTTVEGETGTFGTGVPTLSLTHALQPGDVRRFAGLEDSAFTTIASGRPASFRTNFGIVETAGSTARVRAKIKYPLQASMISTAATLVTGAKDYILAPNQLLLLHNVAREILGEERESTLGDLRGLQVEFEILEGRAHVFVTSTDNGTGDTILRTE
jgi:hypothetical protein